MVMEAWKVVPRFMASAAAVSQAAPPAWAESVPSPTAGGSSLDETPKDASASNSR